MVGLKSKCSILKFNENVKTKLKLTKIVLNQTHIRRTFYISCVLDIASHLTWHPHSKPGIQRKTIVKET